MDIWIHFFKFELLFYASSQLFGSNPILLLWFSRSNCNLVFFVLPFPIICFSFCLQQFLWYSVVVQLTFFLKRLAYWKTSVCVISLNPSFSVLLLCLAFPKYKINPYDSIMVSFPVVNFNAKEILYSPNEQFKWFDQYENWVFVFWLVALVEIEWKHL